MPKPAPPTIPGDGDDKAPILQPMKAEMPAETRAKLDRLRAGSSFDFSDMDAADVRKFFKAWDKVDAVFAFDRHSDRWQTLKWTESSGPVTAIGVIVANDEQAKMLCAGLSLRARGELFKARMECWLAGMRALGDGRPLPDTAWSMTH